MADVVLGFATLDDARHLAARTQPIGRRIAAALAPADVPADVPKALFHRLVADCCRRAPFLPARPGLRAHDAFFSVCATCEDTLAQTIATLGRRVELAISAVLPPPVPVDGRGYLAARRREDDRLTLFAATVSDIARQHDGTCRLARRNRGVDGSILLARAAMAALVRDLTNSGAAAAEDLSVRVSGPWPPYRFAAAALPELT